ncbi:MAG: aminotransferase class I/II-fold pyridoxal phosphate-dependent enzyme [Planctomycetota bacterium]|nr:aminotransferase class I/II-fold pyridoxal phosphate-dependent enzyme [Planctomycetota bacterium]
MSLSLDLLLDELFSQRAQAQQLRTRRIVRSLDAVHVEIDGVRFTNFCGNDYLGLTHHPRIIAALAASAAINGCGAGAAGLISGYTPAHAAAEAAIAGWKGTGASILLPSGYQANHAAIQTVASVGGAKPGRVRFLIDKLAHASLLDAVRGANAPWRVFPHNGIKKLARLLREAEAGQLQVVITESIFSMDGDAADLAALAELKSKHPFVLLLDEAHAGGVYGPGGAGLAAELKLSGAVDISIATLSKAAGVAGGAICASQKFRDAVVNLGRAYIYSTSVPPAIADAIRVAIEVMKDESQRAARVRALAKEVRDRLKTGGLDLPAGDSPIIPIIIGDEAAALRRARELADRKLLVQAVRPPSVPRNTSRLRVTLSCEHTDAEIGQLIETLLK